MVVMIVPTGPQDAVRLARRFLEAAGEIGHDDVATVWDEWAGVAFVVPDDLAVRVFGWQPCPPVPVEERVEDPRPVAAEVPAANPGPGAAGSSAATSAAGRGRATRATSGRRSAGGGRPRFSDA